MLDELKETIERHVSAARKDPTRDRWDPKRKAYAAGYRKGLENVLLTIDLIAAQHAESGATE